MNEKDKILDQLQSLGVTTDIFGEELIQRDRPMEPELFSGKTVEKESKTSYKKGLDYAVRILGLRDYSIYKMKQKLKERGIEKEDTEKIITQLLTWNYLREEEYTKQRIKMMIVKGYANSLIKRKLEQEHLEVEMSIIEEIRATSEDLSSESQLNYLIQKKLRGKEIPTEFNEKMKLKNKITRFLVSKGYGFDEINKGLNQSLS